MRRFRTWRRARTAAATLLLAGGVATFWLADSLYLVRTANGTYESGNWFEIGWWLGLVMIAAAAWQPVRRTRALALEARFGDAVAEDLARRGHGLRRLGSWSDTVGHAQAIRLDPGGLFVGGGDPRADGPALGC